MSRTVVLLGLLFALAAHAQPRPSAVTAAQTDLAARLQVPVDRLVVRSVQKRDWPDASLGCPQPGKVYAQVVTPGLQILLQSGQDEYEYHSDNAGQVRFCSHNIVSSLDMPPIVEVARQDLARRLKCTPAEITVVETPYVDWPTQTLGEPYTPSITRQLRTGPGYKPVLSCGGKEYEYSTGLDRDVRFVRELPADTTESYRLAFLQPSAQPQGDNIYDLAVRDSVTRRTGVLGRSILDFAAAPLGGQALLTHVTPDGQVALTALGQGDRPLLTAADLRAPGWDTAGRRYTAWTRDIPEGQWRLVLGTLPGRPVIFAVSPPISGPDLPQAPQWQGDLLAFSYDDSGQPTSALLNNANGAPAKLVPGRFAGWLDAPGEYLRFKDDQLSRETISDPSPHAILTSQSGLVWARPLPGDQVYVFLTQEGDKLRLWSGPLDGQTPPVVISELQGKFVQAQVSQRGTLALVQSVVPRVGDQTPCRVTMVKLPGGEQEPLSGVCGHAQLLPPLLGPEK